MEAGAVVHPREVKARSYHWAMCPQCFDGETSNFGRYGRRGEGEG